MLDPVQRAMVKAALSDNSKTDEQKIQILVKCGISKTEAIRAIKHPSTNTEDIMEMFKDIFGGMKL
jgi:predicted oxidoreductase